MWMKEVFGTDKPVIGMLHLMAMPTDPKYDPKGGIQAVVDRARADVLALQEGGIDGILFCNEFSIPYVENVRTVTVACMARVIGELLKDIKVPFGVDVACDPYKCFDLAAATGASFIRETLFGAAVSNYGITSIQMGEVERHRYEVGCQNVHTLAALFPEGSKQIAEREVEDIVKTSTFALNPSALLVFGLNAGMSVDDSLIVKAKKVTDTPVFASNGVKAETVADTLAVADGCVVGTWLKYDGYFYNAVDVTRVKKLMEAAKAFRGNK